MKNKLISEAIQLNLTTEERIKLQNYMLRAEQISKGYNLRIQMSKVIRRVINALPIEQIKILINDTGHGFHHGLDIAEHSLLILSKENGDISRFKEEVAIGGLLHDINGIKLKLPKGTDLRHNHHVSGSKLLQRILPEIIGDQNIDIEMVVKSVLYHQEDVKDFKEKVQRTENNLIYLAAAIVRDADTYDEGANVSRIISITENYASETEKNVLKKSLSLPIRIAILMTEEPSVRDAGENDLLMFLLRNVTKGIDEDHYVTDGAKQMMRSGVFETNKELILQGIDDYKYQGDYTGDKEVISQIINDVRELYLKLKEQGLIDQAKEVSLTPKTGQGTKTKIKCIKSSMEGKNEAKTV